jgi:hypothetical protein
MVMLLFSYGLSFIQTGKNFQQAREAFILGLRLSLVLELAKLNALHVYVACFGLRNVAFNLNRGEQLVLALAMLEEGALLQLSAEEKYRQRNLTLSDIG